MVQTLSNIPCYSSRSNALACEQATSLKPSGSLSREFFGSADVFGTVGFGATAAAYNGRLVTEAFDTLFIILCLKGAHMHFVLFDIASHDVLPSLFPVDADVDF